VRFLDVIRSRLGKMTVASTALFAAVTTYGEFFEGAPNAACYLFLGCDEGFFGYDALEHFLFGFAAVWIIVRLCELFPRYSILPDEYWKCGLIVLSLVALVAVGWEFCEWFRDAYLLDIAHQPLLNLRLHINYLAQPSNFDTMGDLSFTLLGSFLALLFLTQRPFR
jgi:hypothetical protein